MRIIFAATALLGVASPALAENPRPVRLTPEQATAALHNPLVQEAGARALTQLIGIVLDTRVGSVGSLIAPDASIRPEDTLRDFAHRDDPHFEEHLYGASRQALGKAATVAGAASTQAGELKRTTRRLEAALSPLIAALASSD